LTKLGLILVTRMHCFTKEEQIYHILVILTSSIANNIIQIGVVSVSFL
jgi:hypothetical protein